jgi:hypothetical protein
MQLLADQFMLRSARGFTGTDFVVGMQITNEKHPSGRTTGAAVRHLETRTLGDFRVRIFKARGIEECQPNAGKRYTLNVFLGQAGYRFQQ